MTPARKRPRITPGGPGRRVGPGADIGRRIGPRRPRLTPSGPIRVKAPEQRAGVPSPSFRGGQPIRPGLTPTKRRLRPAPKRPRLTPGGPGPATGGRGSIRPGLTSTTRRLKKPERRHVGQPVGPGTTIRRLQPSGPIRRRRPGGLQPSGPVTRRRPGLTPSGPVKVQRPKPRRKKFTSKRNTK